jgi:glyoxylase-like metal-dependent hydrolase (beta-lactamase superfamily II)
MQAEETLTPAPRHFRQFRDAATSAFSYLVGCGRVGEAVLIDPVAGHVPLYLGVLGELGLRLAWVLETHLHADHLTAADALREWTGAQVAVGGRSGIDAADRLLADGDAITVGGLQLVVMDTPGHTPGCVTYRWDDRLFTGDSLLIGGCGRIDEPGGNGVLLYDSVTRRLLSLADETLVYPGHGPNGRWVGCIGEERERNPYFHDASRDAFVVQRAAAVEPVPAAIGTNLAANRRCGRLTAADLRPPRPGEAYRHD